ncbi:P-loop ATPase [Pseudomonas sp. 57B-090624]|nr:P-loop ATPase [Pseudomonas sp. 57B-090624]
MESYMVEIKPVPWAHDKMNRQGVSRFITRYLDNNPDVKVLNINAPWGAGKTFFLTNWRDELSMSRACIYFNAWENDYSGDPFIALTSIIHDGLGELIGSKEQAVAKLEGFRRQASKAIIAATPVIAKGILKKVTGVEVAALTDAVEKESVAEAAEVALDNLLKSNQDTLKVIAGFKKKFSELAASAAKNQAKSKEGKVLPLYIFIDELDRCRPTYAIELLERIKHFFDIENCKFIIATDTEQLKHSVGAVYGAGFGAERYLKRFFDAEYSLDYSDLDRWVSTLNFDVRPVRDSPIVTVYAGRPRWEEQRHTAPNNSAVLAGDYGLAKEQIIILAVAKTFRIKPRELEKCYRHLCAIASVMSVSKFDLFWGWYLVVLKDEAPDYYDQFVRRNDGSDWESFRKKYPPAGFYVGNENIDVHALFQMYNRCCHRGKARFDKQFRNEFSGSDVSDYVLSGFLEGAAAKTECNT